MAHIDWRLNITSGTYGGIAEWVPFDGSSTQIATTGGTASADDSTFGAAANAFDGNASTFWSPNGPQTFPHWLRYQFPSAVEIDSFTLATRNDGSWGSTVIDIDLQYSDDGGTTWTTKYSYRGISWSSTGQVVTFNAANALPALGIAWRALINSSYAATQVEIGEIVLRDGGGSAIATTKYAATASTTWAADAEHGAYSAFNGDGNTTFWSATSGTFTGWVAYRFSSLTQVASFCITSPANVGPSSVTLQYSLDEATWTSVATETPTNSNLQQCFTLGGTFPAAASITVSPSAGVQGNAYTVTITGTDTNFSAGVTTVSFGGAGGTVSGVSVASATSLTFTLTLSGSAALGPQTITVTTGAEAPTATFTVAAAAGSTATNWGFVG